MKEEDISSEKAMKQIQKIFKKRGTKALEMARKEILQEKIECKEVREALSYFMNKYWHDLARPSLLSLASEAVGGDPKLTTSVAVALSLSSGAIDIHDDIIDRSKRKYGRQTVYGKYGKDLAILIGDALLFKGLTLLQGIVKENFSVEKMSQIMDIVQKMFFELGDAEALELPLRGRLDVSPEEYLRIVEKKAADVEAHTRIGAILGGGSTTAIEDFGTYGRLLGMLIILRDDWIDLIDPEECRQRVRKECLPLPLLYAAKDVKAKQKIKALLRKKRLSLTDANAIWEIAQTHGMNQFQKITQNLANGALTKLRRKSYFTSDLGLLLKAITPTVEVKCSTTTKSL